MLVRNAKLPDELLVLTPHEIYQLIAHHAALDPSIVTERATFESLGVDSVAQLEIIFAIEDKFGILLNFDDSKGVIRRSSMTVGDLIHAAEIALSCKPFG